MPVAAAHEYAEKGALDMPAIDAPAILVVKHLGIGFPNRYSDIALVDNLIFSVAARQTMALVSESGCGKSISALAIMGLLDKQAVIKGEARFVNAQGKAQNLLADLNQMYDLYMICI